VAKSKALTERQIAEHLEALRLDRRWSYRELGDQIGRTLNEPGIPEATLRKFIQLAGERGFHDTTVHPLRKYVDAMLLEKAS
jgi:hypothetical protein